MTLDKLIITSLQNGPLLKTELIQLIKKSRPSTARQTVYRILKKLSNDEIVILKNKRAALDLNWIFETQEFLANAQFHYAQQSSNSLNFLTLKDSNKINYTFSTLSELDTFCNQILHILNTTLPGKEPLFAYNPDQWFYYSRNKYEQNLIKAFRQKARLTLVTLVFKDPLNVKLKQMYSGGDIQYAFEPNLINGKPNYYFGLMGEFLIEITVDPNLNNKLRDFFKKYSSFSTQAQQDVQTIINTLGKNKVTITRNSKKAYMFKKHLSKKFAIKPL